MTREDTTPGHPVPRPVRRDDEISGVIATAEARVRLQELQRAHQRTRAIAIQAREQLIAVCGPDGNNGKLSLLFDARDKQGERLGKLDKTLTQQETRITLLESGLAAQTKKVEELDRRTDKLGAKVAGLAGLVTLLIEVLSRVIGQAL